MDPCNVSALNHYKYPCIIVRSFSNIRSEAAPSIACKQVVIRFMFFQIFDSASSSQFGISLAMYIVID